MPSLKNRMLFISHAWAYNADYWTIVKWLNAVSNFKWSNCSVPSHDGLPDKTTAGLKRAITRQLNPAQAVVIIGGMYAAHSDWIDYEIDEAVRLNKTIIGIRPWAQKRVPTKIQQNATTMVNWNSSSLISAIGRSALKCGVVKSAVMRGKSCHTATWRLSENSSIHTGVRAHHRCMTFFGVTSDFDHNSRHLTPTTLNCGATSAIREYV